MKVIETLRACRKRRSVYHLCLGLSWLMVGLVGCDRQHEQEDSQSHAFQQYSGTPSGADPYGFPTQPVEGTGQAFPVPNHQGSCLITDLGLGEVFSCEEGVSMSRCLGPVGNDRVYYFSPDSCDATKSRLAEGKKANAKAYEEFAAKKGACIVLDQERLTSCTDDATHESCHCPDGATGPYGCSAKQSDRSDWRKVVYGMTCAEVKSTWFADQSAQGESR